MTTLCPSPPPLRSSPRSASRRLLSRASPPPLPSANRRPASSHSSSSCSRAIIVTAMEKMDLESKYEPMPSPASGRVQTMAALGARVSSSQAQRERAVLVQSAPLQPGAAGGSSWWLINCCSHDASKKSRAVQLAGAGADPLSVVPLVSARSCCPWPLSSCCSCGSISTSADWDGRTRRCFSMRIRSSW